MALPKLPQAAKSEMQKARLFFPAEEPHLPVPCGWNRAVPILIIPTVNSAAPYDGAIGRRHAPEALIIGPHTANHGRLCLSAKYPVIG